MTVMLVMQALGCCAPWASLHGRRPPLLLQSTGRLRGRPLTPAILIKQHVRCGAAAPSLPLPLMNRLLVLLDVGWPTFVAAYDSTLAARVEAEAKAKAAA